MKRILVLLDLCLLATVSFIASPAFAESGEAGPELAPEVVAHWAITVLGLAVAGRLAFQAFGRAVPVDNFPTVPIYMTSRQQYRLGWAAFVAFACGFFLLLVQEHREVLILAKPLNIIPDSISAAIDGRSTSYLLIVTAMGTVYLYLLAYEKPWNVLLMMRDVIRSWISVPQLAKRIMAQIRLSLHVPQEGRSAVIAASNGVVTEQDFRKEANTPDRKWAETGYMKWWLTEALDAGGDAIFFAEDSFAFNALIDDFNKAAPDVRQWKSGAVVPFPSGDLPRTIDGLHARFARLVACYLIYRYGSHKDLNAAARGFGITLSEAPPANPLRYWIVYVIALMASVYVGVHVSAILYDLATGRGLTFAQDPNLALEWGMYSVSNYGVAIIVILLLRLLAGTLDADISRSHLITYCWTFVAAFFVGPAGLTVAAKFFAPPMYSDQPVLLLYYNVLKWGLGPALVCVYISYYLDRQIYSDLPNIVHSSRTVGWRLLNCSAFAAVTLFLLLPYLLTLPPTPGDAWSVEKLRFVASGTIFCLTLGLALAAQFALRAAGPAQGATSPPPIASPSPPLVSGSQ